MHTYEKQQHWCSYLQHNDISVVFPSILNGDRICKEAPKNYVFYQDIGLMSFYPGKWCSNKHKSTEILIFNIINDENEAKILRQSLVVALSVEEQMLCFSGEKNVRKTLSVIWSINKLVKHKLHCCCTCRQLHIKEIQKKPFHLIILCP